MTGRSNHLRPAVLITLVACTLITEAAFITSSIATQEDPQSLAYQAYTGLTYVYKENGEAPDLLNKLNTAVDLIQQAKVALSRGDPTLAAQLQNQARTQLTEVIDQIPVAQRDADLAAANTMLTAVLLIPISVGISTFIFYSALRTWRGYERLKLYEMEILEKKKD